MRIHCCDAAAISSVLSNLSESWRPLLECKQSAGSLQCVHCANRRAEELVGTCFMDVVSLIEDIERRIKVSDAERQESKSRWLG